MFVLEVLLITVLFILEGESKNFVGEISSPNSFEIIVSASLVDFTTCSLCHILKAQNCCLCMNDCFTLPLAPHPPLPYNPSPSTHLCRLNP